MLLSFKTKVQVLFLNRIHANLFLDFVCIILRIAGIFLTDDNTPCPCFNNTYLVFLFIC